MAPLDNPVWHALTGPQAGFSQGTGLALRYEPEVGAFAGLPDEPTAEAWDALAALLGPATSGVVFRTDGIVVPDAWQVAMRLPTLQMVSSGALGEPDAAFEELGAADVDDMLALDGRDPARTVLRAHR